MTMQPIRIAIANDYELVVAGVHEILKPYADRVDVVELNANTPVAQPVDIVLFDTFGAMTSLAEALEALHRNWSAQRVVLYTWEFTETFRQTAQEVGVHAMISKSLGGAELVAALEEVHGGNEFISRGAERPEHDEEPDETSRRHDWPGRSAGLSMRESEMISLICQGMSNAEIAETSYLSPNSVKSYIRSAYRKIGVATRAQAVAWGIQNGLLPEVSRKAV